MITGLNPSTLGLAGGNKHMDGLITSSGSFQGTTDKTQTGEFFSVRNKNKECKGFEICYNVFYLKKNILRNIKILFYFILDKWKLKKTLYWINFMLKVYQITSISPDKFLFLL